jgi:hypothetical protein
VPVVLADAKKTLDRKGNNGCTFGLFELNNKITTVLREETDEKHYLCQRGENQKGREITLAGGTQNKKKSHMLSFRHK